MGPDKFQQAWQAQGAQTRVTVDSEVLLKEVQRNQRDFRAMIFCRDFREIVIALLLIPLWFYLGAKTSSPWTWYLSVPALLWMAGFMWAYRKRHPQQPSKPDEPLLECAKRSLREVEDQIWLLRNIFWWYLLPPGISIGAFFLQVSWQGAVATNDWLTGLIAATCLLAFLAGIYYFVYCLNQRAVRVQLEPRREELLALLASFGDELTSDYVAWSRAQGIESSRSLRRWVVVALTCLAALAAIAMASGLFQSSDSADDQPPRSVGPAGDALASVVARQRQEKGLVGLAAMVTTGGEVYAAAADGEREID
ncbi:MAG: hypothetical protein IT424_11530, partial [Pirellulales bacterium]|nr:hypothetical protein [Pirellulales bacterium]